MRYDPAAVLAAVFVFSAIPLASQADDDSRDSRVFKLACDARHTLKEALRKARPGDTILVSGICNENVDVASDIRRVTLDGQGIAAINGPDVTAATMEIRGGDIVVKGFTVTGGLFGISVNSGGSATLDGNVVHHTGRAGVQITQSATAVVVNNVIRDNPDEGIRIGENASAHVGFDEARDLRTAKPNTIEGNGSHGIRVRRSASARIYANVIRNNARNGVEVSRAAYADVSSNHIDGNGGDGIVVTQNSAAVLGDDVTEDPVSDDPNSTAVPNAGAGLRCRINSSVDGRRGTLTGVQGSQNFDATCVNSTIP